MAHLDLTTGTYAAAETLLGARTFRKIGHNTMLIRYGKEPWVKAEGQRIAVRYHATDIVTLSADGWLTMRTGGWDTVTTWSRINGLLPGRWAVYSQRGARMLYHAGRAITPYADGLSLHVGYSTGSADGSVGMNGTVLLTAADVAAIETAADEAETSRAATRAARLLREHPVAFGPRTHTRSLYHRRARDCGRCTEELEAERAARQAVLRAEHAAVTAYAAATGATLTIPSSYGPPALDGSLWPESARTAAGSHVTHRTDREHPYYPGREGIPGARDYHAEPTTTERYTVACPWECPDRPTRW